MCFPTSGLVKAINGTIPKLIAMDILFSFTESFSFNYLTNRLDFLQVSYFLDFAYDDDAWVGIPTLVQFWLFLPPIVVLLLTI